jgi:hypothetical protein
LPKKIGKVAKKWDSYIEQLHSICSGLTPKTGAVRVENLISIVQIASDDVKKYIDSSLSSLHVLEDTNSIIRASLTEYDEKVRQINLDLEKGIREFNEKSPE